jgi:RNA polymerase sigma-70 factor (ECF subfamily)
MAGSAPESVPAGDDDEITVARIVAGEKDLFRLLVRRHERAVYGMGLSFFRNGDDAADFVHDVFLKAYRSLGHFEGRARFSTWLYRISYNTAVNSVNRRREYRSLAEDEPASGVDDPERRMLRQTAREAVLAAVKELPEKYRVCVDLFFFYDRSYQEIEAITGIPVNTVKSHVFRAKKLLRDRLEDFGEGEL